MHERLESKQISSLLTHIKWEIVGIPRRNYNLQIIYESRLHSISNINVSGIPFYNWKLEVDAQRISMTTRTILNYFGVNPQASNNVFYTDGANIIKILKSFEKSFLREDLIKNLGSKSKVTLLKLVDMVALIYYNKIAKFTRTRMYNKRQGNVNINGIDDTNIDHKRVRFLDDSDGSSSANTNASIVSSSANTNASIGSTSANTNASIGSTSNTLPSTSSTSNTLLLTSSTSTSSNTLPSTSSTLTSSNTLPSTSSTLTSSNTLPSTSSTLTSSNILPTTSSTPTSTSSTPIILPSTSSTLSSNTLPSTSLSPIILPSTSSTSTSNTLPLNILSSISSTLTSNTLPSTSSQAIPQYSSQAIPQYSSQAIPQYSSQAISQYSSSTSSSSNYALRSRNHSSTSSASSSLLSDFTISTNNRSFREGEANHVQSIDQRPPIVDEERLRYPDIQPDHYLNPRDTIITINPLSQLTGLSQINFNYPYYKAILYKDISNHCFNMAYDVDRFIAYSPEHVDPSQRIFLSRGMSPEVSVVCGKVCGMFNIDCKSLVIAVPSDCMIGLRTIHICLEQILASSVFFDSSYITRVIEAFVWQAKDEIAKNKSTIEHNPNSQYIHVSCLIFICERLSDVCDYIRLYQTISTRVIIDRVRATLAVIKCICYI